MLLFTFRWNRQQLQSIKSVSTRQLYYVQYLNVLSVSILAKISPSGSAMIIMIADANHETASESAIMPKLYIARYR